MKHSRWSKSHPASRCGWLLFLVGALALRGGAHTDQEQPALVAILPQRSFLTVRITGSANDLSDAISSALGAHGMKTASPAAELDVVNLDTRAEVNSYLVHHVLLTQSGQRLKGSLQTLKTYRNTFDDSKADFEAVYRYERDPALADKPLKVSSILFNFLGKSRTVVSLGSLDRTLGNDEETRFEAPSTLPSLRRNVVEWSTLGAFHLAEGWELPLFLLALWCATATLPPRTSLFAVTGFTLAQAVGLNVSLDTASQLSPHLTSLVLSFEIAFMGIYAWIMARGLGLGKSGLARGLVPLATLCGYPFGLPLGSMLRERGLPQEGLSLCILGVIASVLLVQLLVSGAGLCLVARLKDKFEHNAKYGGLSWPHALQWASGTLGSIGTFWILQHLLNS